MGETMPHWLTKQAQLSPDMPALEDEAGSSWTFSELEQASKTFAQKLASFGVRPGMHVGILANNEPYVIIAVHALSYLGAAVVLYNTKLAAAELNYQMDDAETAYVLLSTEMKDLTCDHSWRAGRMPLSFREVDEAEAAPLQLREEIDLDDVFTIMYTSGTTGHPKGVIHTYGNHFWSAAGSALNLGLHKNDKWLALLPMFHIGGLSVFFKSAIYGMPVLLMRRFDPQKVQAAIVNRGVTIASVVTVMLKRLLEELGNRLYPDHFRCMLLGGGAVPLSMLEVAKEREIPVYQSYGMTETSSQIVTLSPNDALSKLGSAGKPLFPAQLQIRNPGQDGVGEIAVKGPMVTRGYYKNQLANVSSFDQGWLKTGDLGRLDEEGFLYVADRRKDLIISGGENIYPAEVEGVLARMEGIEETGVCAVPNAVWGQVPAAFVVLADKQLNATEIEHFAAGNLAKYKVPKHIYIVEKLPRNASGKLMRHILSRWAEERNE